MKRVFLFAMTVMLCISVVGCGKKGESSVKLTDAQKACCTEVEEILEPFAESMNLEFSTEIKEVDKKILYIATLNFDGDFSVENAEFFLNVIVPDMQEIVAKEDMYFVLYLKEYGENEYRIVDSRLNPSILD